MAQLPSTPITVKLLTPDAKLILSRFAAQSAEAQSIPELALVLEPRLPRIQVGVLTRPWSISARGELAFELREERSWVLAIERVQAALAELHLLQLLLNSQPALGPERWSPTFFGRLIVDAVGVQLWRDHAGNAEAPPGTR